MREGGQATREGKGKKQKCSQKRSEKRILVSSMGFGENSPSTSYLNPSGTKTVASILAPKVKEVLERPLNNEAL